MIHHLSIPARDTRHVADVLAELFGGVVTAFGPYPDSWIAWAGDEHGTAIAAFTALRHHSGRTTFREVKRH